MDTEGQPMSLHCGNRYALSCRKPLAGFTIYSWMVRIWVFVITNALMVINGLVGFAIVMRHRRRGRQES